MNNGRSEHSKPLQWIVWCALAAVIVVVAVQLVGQRRMDSPEGPAELPVYSSLPMFTLTNQFGAEVSRDGLAGRIWIADVIFTRCTGPCIKMSREMEELARLMPTNAPVGFLSLSTDPEFDTPRVLRRYQKRFDLGADSWTLLTGGMEDFAKVAIDGLKLPARLIPEEERQNPDDLFIHSTQLALIDPFLQVRGIYEGLGGTDRQRMLDDINLLLERRSP